MDPDQRHLNLRGPILHQPLGQSLGETVREPTQAHQEALAQRCGKMAIRKGQRRQRAGKGGNSAAGRPVRKSTGRRAICAGSEPHRMGSRRCGYRSGLNNVECLTRCGGRAGSNSATLAALEKFGEASSITRAESSYGYKRRETTGQPFKTGFFGARGMDAANDLQPQGDSPELGLSMRQVTHSGQVERATAIRRLMPAPSAHPESSAGS